MRKLSYICSVFTFSLIATIFINGYGRGDHIFVELIVQLFVMACVFSLVNAVIGKLDSKFSWTIAMWRIANYSTQLLTFLALGVFFNWFGDWRSVAICVTVFTAAYVSYDFYLAYKNKSDVSKMNEKINQMKTKK